MKLILQLFVVMAFSLSLFAASAKPLKIYLMAGQSNMQGHAHIKTFAHMKMVKETRPLYDKLVNADGSPKVFKNVWIASLGSQREETFGQLTAKYGGDRAGPKIGPELGFGVHMQEHVNEPILIIKAAWGGKTLSNDFRPPSAGPYSAGPHSEKQKASVQKVVENRRKSNGHYYRMMMDYYKKVLADIKRVYPDYDEKEGYSIEGFVWFQGASDFGDYTTYSKAKTENNYDEYSRLMSLLIKDIRKDLKAPQMKCVIGVLGIKGDVSKSFDDEERPMIIGFRKAMAAPASYPEFKGKVTAVWTEKYWDDELEELQSRWKHIKAKNVELKRNKTMSGQEKKKVMDAHIKTIYSDREWELMEKGVSNAAYHYLGSAKILVQVGKAFADAMHGLDQ